MKLQGVRPLDILLFVACGAVLAANLWFVVPIVTDALSIDGLSASLDEETQNVRRLRSIDNLSFLEKELAQLRTQADDERAPGLPTDIDDLALVYGLLDFVPGSGTRIVGFKELDAKSQTIDGVLFRLLNYEVTLEGDPSEMLTMVKRVDQNRLSNLTVPSLLLTKAESGWNMKAVLVARLPAAVQPTRTPQPTPVVPAKPAPTPSPSPVRR